MLVKEMKQVEVALAVVRDSERLLINLRVSILTHASTCELSFGGLVWYLRATRCKLRVQLVFFAIRAMWQGISKKFWSLIDA